MTITAEILIENGYNKYPAYHKGDGVTLYQKRVNSIDFGFTRYFIDIYEYDFSKYNSHIIYEVDCQFTDDDGVTLNVSFSAQEMTVDMVENKVEEIFRALNCVPYDR